MILNTSWNTLNYHKQPCSETSSLWSLHHNSSEIAKNVSELLDGLEGVHFRNIHGKLYAKLRDNFVHTYSIMFSEFSLEHVSIHYQTIWSNQIKMKYIYMLSIYIFSYWQSRHWAVTQQTKQCAYSYNWKKSNCLHSIAGDMLLRIRWGIRLRPLPGRSLTYLVQNFSTQEYISSHTNDDQWKNGVLNGIIDHLWRIIVSDSYYNDRTHPPRGGS